MVDATGLVNELQEMRESGHLSDALLRHAVRTIAGTDDRFDWVGVYLLNEEEGKLWLHNYVGAPTEHAVITVGEGVVGSAAAERSNKNVPDVSAAENYLACSPNVRSELVVLIRTGEDVFGEIDIDSHQPAAFTEEDERTLAAVADVLAQQIASERR